MKDLSDDEKARRKPLPPDVLANALSDTVHTNIGKGRPVNTYKIKGEDNYHCREVKMDRDRLLNEIEGARDMLREAAKQFRILGQDGHAGMCENHVAKLSESIARGEVTGK